MKLLKLKIDHGFIIQLMLLSFIFCSIRFLFQPCVYYKHKFITVKFSKMMHHEILSEEEFFSVLYADTFSDCPSDIHTSVSEDDSFSEYSSDSDDVNIRPTKRQKTLVIDFDMASENETHSAGECSFASTEEWIEDNIS